MTLAQIEERLTVLEKVVADLQARLPPANGTPPAAEEAAPFLKEEDIIPGAEYPFVPDVPPREVVHLKGRIVSIERDPAVLGLSDAEWASLGLEKDDS
jgi:hypothetical protein